jgi:mono/diheme cytochrome c family protein
MYKLLVLPLVVFAFPTIARAAGDAEKGKPIYVAQCVTCHGRTGDGDGPVGKVLNPRPRAFSKSDLPTDERMKNVIQKGGKANGLSKDMDAYPALSDQQVADVIAYIRTLSK